MVTRKNSVNLNQLSFMAGLDTTKLDPLIIFPRDPRFNDFINDWKNSRFFGLDIETRNVENFGDGLNPYKGKIRLIQISLPKRDEVLIVDMEDTVPVVFLDTLKATCESETQHQVGAFIQFDLTWLQQQLNIHSNKPYDIRILSILLWCGIKWDGNRKRFSHSLKDIYFRLFGIELNKEAQVSDWSQPALTNTQFNYAATDARVLLPCFQKLSVMLKEYDSQLDLTGSICTNKLTDIAKIECFAIPLFVQIILTGQPIDLEKASQVRKQYVDAISDLYQPVMDSIHLTYSASASNLAKAIWEKYNILLTEEVVSYDDEGNREDLGDTVKINQLGLFGNEMPNLPPNTKLSTASANLFHHYTQTNNDALIRISLARSLKKAVDSLDALVASAGAIDGYAKGRYTSLGSTGSGRSTCAGDKKSSLPQTNLQNITGQISHALLDKYNLPKIRSIITNNAKDGMWLVDLSASHLRIAAYNSKDIKLVEILGYQDPHSLLTSKMLGLDGKYPAGTKDEDANRLYCENNKKVPEISYYRDIAKVALY